MIEILPVTTPSLGDRSYLATDGTVAVVVDPQRDYDRVLGLARSRGLRISHVCETHIHNDYVTGGYQLARAAGAAYLVSADDTVSFDRVPVHDRDVFNAGDMLFRAVATPGHTFSHLSYTLESAGETMAVFTGGSLLYGSTGRPDLLGAEHAKDLAHHQYHSAHRLASELPASTAIYPTHGFGSFCTANQLPAPGTIEAGEDLLTIGEESASNPVLTLDEEVYVREVLAGLDGIPAYYAQVAPKNQAGPSEIDLSPPALASPRDLRWRLSAGEWLVDLRYRTAFAIGHLPGTINLGIEGSFITYLGWLLPWGTPVTLLGETQDQVAAAQRDLARIGIDRPAAAAVGAPSDWSGGGALGRTRLATFADLREADREDLAPKVLDVRRHDERAASHLLGSAHIPVHELPSAIAAGMVPLEGTEVWVHCSTGYRAALAASLLARSGGCVVLIDEDYEMAEIAGLPVVLAVKR